MEVNNVADVINNIKKSCQTRNIPENIWLNALNNQTVIYQESQQLKSMMNSNKFDSPNCGNVSLLLTNKLNDLKLCKDVDEESVGRANSRRSAKPSLLSAALKKKLILLQDKFHDTTDSGPSETKDVPYPQNVQNSFVNDGDNEVKTGNNSMLFMLHT